MKDAIKLAFTVVIAIPVLTFLFWVDFKIWRIQHPGIPGWTYIFRR